MTNTSQTPWAFIAHKDGYWAGVCSSTVEKADLQEFLGDFATDGFSILTVYDRKEYAAVLATLKPWHESPAYQAKYPVKEEPTFPLFDGIEG